MCTFAYVCICAYLYVCVHKHTNRPILAIFHGTIFSGGPWPRETKFVSGPRVSKGREPLDKGTFEDFSGNKAQ